MSRRWRKMSSGFGLKNAIMNESEIATIEKLDQVGSFTIWTDLQGFVERLGWTGSIPSAAQFEVLGNLEFLRAIFIENYFGRVREPIDEILIEILLRNTKLHVLGIAYIPFLPNATIAFQENDSIECLRLQGCSLKNEDLLPIGTMKRLKYLNIFNNPQLELGAMNSLLEKCCLDRVYIDNKESFVGELATRFKHTHFEFK